MGTYPVDGAGSPAGLGEGIWRVGLVDGALVDAVQVAVAPSPSFLAVHPSGHVLYAVGETPVGTISAFAVHPAEGLHAGDLPTQGPHTVRSAAGATLSVEETITSGGADPCHLLLSPDARALYVANYTSGTVGVVPLTADGAFEADVVASGAPAQVFTAGDSGSAGPGPDPDRQDGPHAHFAALAPGGRHLLVVDLGTDELRRFVIEPDGTLTADGLAGTLPPGTGPRHLVAGPHDHLYVTGELDSTVHVLRWESSTATTRPVQVVPACAAVPSDASSGDRNLPSHLVLVGDQLHVAVRGADVVSTFAVSADGARLEALGETSTGGDWPRHLVVVAGEATHLVVADQVSSRLAVLDVASSGELVVRDFAHLPAPACVVEA